MTTRSVRTLTVIAAAAASVLGVAGAMSPAASAAPSGTVSIPNTLPRWLASATPAATALRATATPMSVRVYLAPNGGLDALKAEVAAVSDPSSARYRQFLTTAQYSKTYAPTAAAAAKVADYLRAHGVKVDGVEAHRRYVSATADQATLAKAFGTQLGSFVHDGQAVVAPTSAVTLPADVGAQVLTVSGLDTTTQLKKHDNVLPDDASTAAAPAVTAAVAPTASAELVVPPPAGFRNARPCNIEYGTVTTANTSVPDFKGEALPFAPCGYTGPQVRSAYEGGTKLTGAGVTVAITDAYAWQLMASDAQRYAELNGDGSYAPGQYTENLPATFMHGFACDPTGWSGEEALDVESVHAMAPAANIRYYGSTSCFDDDFTDTLGRVVDENKAQIVTNSWSDLEQNEGGASIAAYEQVFLQGALQGQSFYFSSGDNGDELAKTGRRQVDYPASDPYVTAAGGTATAIAGGKITGQTGWGTRTHALSKTGPGWTPGSYLYGAGGGFSALFNRPSYQDGVVPASSPAGRGVPDVSMDADPNTGFLVGQTQAFPEGVHYDEYRIGGTSLASPLLAGMTALAAQHAGGGLGLLNPLFYSLKAGITDVLPNGMPDEGVVRVNYNNGVQNAPIQTPSGPVGGTSVFVRTFGDNSSLQTTKGWDTTTGIGVPNQAFLPSVSK